MDTFLNIYIFLTFFANNFILETTQVPILYEGRTCGESNNGVCTAVRNCSSALAALKRDRRHNLDRCGFEGFEEIVCCPDPESAEYKIENNSSYEGIWTDELTSPRTTKSQITATESVVFEPSSRSPTIRKSEAACEEFSNEIRAQVSLQIFGGENAEPGEFPHMAAIGYTDDDNEEIEYKCGGSLIHRKFVLTAAHCVVVNNGIKPVQVRLGKLDIRGNTDNLVSEDYKISNVFIHPNYKRRTKENDIALIRLKKRVKNTDYVHPACLYSKKDNPEKMIVTGWGYTSHNGESSNILQKVTLESVPTSHCNQTYYSRLTKEITQNQICAVSNDGIKDTCQGDSGGPIQIEILENSSMYSIVGITSFGVSCGGKVPGVYTRVSNYLDWIESIIWPE